MLGGEGTHTGTSDGVPRVDLPTVYYTDGPVGVRSGQATAMPIPMGLAASFDMKLARLHGATIGTEARAKGNDVVYAPTVNILRTPLWGRAFETYGEDPYLSGADRRGLDQGRAVDRRDRERQALRREQPGGRRRAGRREPAGPAGRARRRPRGTG